MCWAKWRLRLIELRATHSRVHTRGHRLRSHVTARHTHRRRKTRRATKSISLKRRLYNLRRRIALNLEPLRLLELSESEGFVSLRQRGCHRSRLTTHTTITSAPVESHVSWSVVCSIIRSAHKLSSWKCIAQCRWWLIRLIELALTLVSHKTLVGRGGEVVVPTLYHTAIGVPLWSRCSLSSPSHQMNLPFVRPRMALPSPRPPTRPPFL